MAKKYNLSDVFFAGADFAATASNILDRQLKEKAESDLMYMQAQLDSNASAFMNDLAQRNDYQNWQGAVDKFITQQGDRLQKESANAYTAKRAQEMMLRYRGELEQKVQLEALAKQKEDTLVTNQHTLALIRANFSGQERINKESVLQDRQYANGSIDESRYHAESVNGANTTEYEYYVSKGTDLFEDAIDTEKGFSYIENAIDSDATKFELKVLTSDSANVEALENGTAKYIDISSSINTKENKKQAKKTLRNSYNAYVNDLQRANENQLSEIYTKLMNPNLSDTEKLAIASKGITTLETMKGERLDPNVRDEYAKKFSLVKDSNGSLFSGSKNQIKQLSQDAKDFNNLIDFYIAAAKRGTLSSEGGFENMYTAKESLTESIYDELEKKGIKGDEAVEWIGANTKLYQMVEKFCEDVLNSPEYAGVKQNLKDLAKDISKNPDKWPEDAIGFFTGYLLDSFAQSDMSKVNPGDFIKQLNNLKATVYGKKIDNLLTIKNINNEKSVGETVQNLGSVDAVYTDIYGNLRWNENAKNLFYGEKGAATQLAKVVSDATGIDLSNLKTELKQTHNGNDVTNIPIYKDKDGNSYEVIPIYKDDDESKKVTGYKVVDQNGNVYQNSRNRKEEDKKAKKENKQKIKEAQTKQAELLEKRFEEQKEELSKVKNPPKELNISQEAWDMMSPSDRVLEYKKYGLITK